MPVPTSSRRPAGSIAASASSSRASWGSELGTPSSTLLASITTASASRLGNNRSRYLACFGRRIGASGRFIDLPGPGEQLESDRRRLGALARDELEVGGDLDLAG